MNIDSHQAKRRDSARKDMLKEKIQEHRAFAKTISPSALEEPVLQSKVDGWIASFDFGFIEGIMLLDADLDCLQERATRDDSSSEAHDDEDDEVDEDEDNEDDEEIDEEEQAR
ncbi:uncharacterized protein KY384_005097 [Bacidia gigantensis]|uniref:uncharacterized protein n=1 Tax=Bacidia gigantensis TaxID=2732470 RepID=UPI001D044D59|nr:uncharacterized protein KY384_005097 [Bacidia gigantensis]KAG8530594.1 hypothetical protein KY384_005097 [Bacidia gigantensis]